jgi:hypothetical protein
MVWNVNMLLLLILVVYAGAKFIILTAMTKTGADVLPLDHVVRDFAVFGIQQPERPTNDNCFDLFIPYHISDQEVFIQIGDLNSIRKHIQGWRRIFIISAESASIASILVQDERIAWRSEETFSFSRNHQHERLGNWYLQQSLKLLAPMEMPEMCNTLAPICTLSAIGPHCMRQIDGSTFSLEIILEDTKHSLEPLPKRVLWPLRK